MSSMLPLSNPLIYFQIIFKVDILTKAYKALHDLPTHYTHSILWPLLLLSPNSLFYSNTGLLAVPRRCQSCFPMRAGRALLESHVAHFLTSFKSLLKYHLLNEAKCVSSFILQPLPLSLWTYQIHLPCSIFFPYDLSSYKI